MSASTKKHVQAEDLKTRLAKWREEKERHGRAPIKRPFPQANKPAQELKRTTHPTQTAVTKDPTTKPTAIIKPRTQNKGTSNQENEELKKRLEEWRKKKVEEKQEKDKNRRLTFIPTSRAVLPSVANIFPPKVRPAKLSLGNNNRHTFNVANAAKLSRYRVSLCPPCGTSISLADRNQQLQNPPSRKISPPKKLVVKKSTSGHRMPVTAKKRTSPKTVAVANGRDIVGHRRRVVCISKGRSSPRTAKPSDTNAAGKTATNNTGPLAKPTANRTSSKPPNSNAPKVAVTGARNRISVSSTGLRPSTGIGAKQRPVPNKPLQSKAKSAAATVRMQNHLLKRQSPRNNTGVKCLAITAMPVKINEKVMRRSVSASDLPVSKCDKMRRSLSNQHFTKKNSNGKSILKVPCMSVTEAEVILVDSATPEMDVEKTPPVEVKGNGVRFTVSTGTTPCTPRTLRTPGTGSKHKSGIGLTPDMARRKKLNDWLISKGKTPSRFRHLCCFDEQVSAEKKMVAATKPGLSTNELKKQQNLLDMEGDILEADPLEQLLMKGSHASRRESTHAELVIDAELADELRSMLDECTQLFEAGCPSESVIGWLDDIADHFPRATANAAYWICRATIIEEAEDDHATVDLYEQACRHNAQPAAELAQALRRFVGRMEERAHKAKLAAHTPRYAKTPLVQRENCFESSSIKYSISNTTPFFKKLHSRADQQGTPLSVITPVRRSTRRSLLKLPEMLRDHDVIMESLDDVPVADRATTLYLPNDALGQSEDEEAPVESGPPSPKPLQRSLTAELFAAADDNESF